MADSIVQPISTVMSSASGVIPTAVATDPLAGLSGFANAALNLFVDNREQSLKVQKDRRKQLADEAELAAKNAAARASVDIYGGLTEGGDGKDLAVDPGVAAAVQGAAAEYKKAETASKQGRMSMSALNVKTERAYRDLFRRFPGQEYEIVKALRENGMDTPLTYEFKRIEQEQAALDTGRNQALTKFTNKALEAGFDPNTPFPTLVQAGQRIVEKETELSLAKQMQELQQGQFNLTKAQQEQAEAAANKAIFKAHQLNIHNGLDQGLQMIETWIAQKPVGEDGDVFIAQMMPQFELALNNFARNARRQAIEAGAGPEMLKMIDEDIEARKEQMQAMLSGSFSELEQTVRTRRLLEERLKISSIQSVPLLHALRAAVGDTAIASFVIKSAIVSDPELVKKLSAEAQGFVQMGDTGLRSATKHLEQRLALLMGDTSIKDLPRDQAIKELPVMIKAHRGLTEAALTGDNPVAAQVAVNSLMNISLEALDLVPQDGVKPLSTAANVMTNPKTVQLMTQTFKEGDARSALAMGQYRASTQATLQKLIDAKAPEETNPSAYYSIQMNEKSGRWEMKFNKEKWDKDQARVNATGKFAGLMSSAPVRPSDELVSKVAALNQAVDAMVDTEKFDPNSPLKQATPLEIRNFYASGGRAIPESMRQQGLDGKTTDQRQKVMSWQEQGTAILEELGNYNSQPFREATEFGLGAQPTQQIEEEYRDNPNVPLAKAAANTHGVPASVALNLFSTESKFDPTATSSKGAYGLGQVMPSTAALYKDYMREKYGTTELKKLTPAQNADLSMKILKDNYDRLKSWPDAVSAYHSGKPLSQLTDANNDGNLHTTDYVRKVLG